jgi:hypothetical protein
MGGGGVGASAVWGEFRQPIRLTRSREAAKNVKNAKKRVCYGLFVPSLEEFSSAMEFRPLRVLRGFA